MGCTSGALAADCICGARAVGCTGSAPAGGAPEADCLCDALAVGCIGGARVSQKLGGGIAGAPTGEAVTVALRCLEDRRGLRPFTCCVCTGVLGAGALLLFALADFADVRASVSEVSYIGGQWAAVGWQGMAVGRQWAALGRQWAAVGGSGRVVGW